MIKKLFNSFYKYGFIKTVKKIKDYSLNNVSNYRENIKTKQNKIKKELIKYIDEPVLDLLNMKKVYSYLKDNYSIFDNTFNYFKNNKTFQNPVIWICWLQGYDNFPDIVKTCYKSVKEHSSGYEVILITDKNINDYVNIPEHIMKKYQDGIITRTHFSDILRLLLLINYGGIWIDATVFLSGNIPEYIKNSDLFMFKTSHFDKNAFLPASSWFIAAKKENPILIKVFNVLSDFWKNETNMMNYFLFHISFLLVIKNDQESIELWNKILYKNNCEPHVLQFKMFEEYSTEVKNHIWQISFAHKLTYFDDSLTKKKDTFYDYIINL